MCHIVVAAGGFQADLKNVKKEPNEHKGKKSLEQVYYKDELQCQTVFFFLS